MTGTALAVRRTGVAVERLAPPISRAGWPPVLAVAAATVFVGAQVAVLLLREGPTIPAPDKRPIVVEMVTPPAALPIEPDPEPTPEHTAPREDAAGPAVPPVGPVLEPEAPPDGPLDVPPDAPTNTPPATAAEQSPSFDAPARYGVDLLDTEEGRGAFAMPGLTCAALPEAERARRGCDRDAGQGAVRLSLSEDEALRMQNDALLGRDLGAVLGPSFAGLKTQDLREALGWSPALRVPFVPSAGGPIVPLRSLGHADDLLGPSPIPEPVVNVQKPKPFGGK